MKRDDLSLPSRLAIESEKQVRKVMLEITPMCRDAWAIEAILRTAFTDHARDSADMALNELQKMGESNVSP